MTHAVRPLSEAEWEQPQEPRPSYVIAWVLASLAFWCGFALVAGVAIVRGWVN